MMPQKNLWEPNAGANVEIAATSKGYSSVKPVSRTLLYYLLAISLILFFNIAPGFKTGPCTPNVDILSIMLAFFGAVVLLAINGIQIVRYGRIYLPSFIIHALVIAFCVISVKIGS